MKKILLRALNRTTVILRCAVQKVIDRASQGLALFVQYEDVPSNFVHLTVHVGTSETPVQLKPLLALFLDNFFNSPIMRDGMPPFWLCYFGVKEIGAAHAAAQANGGTLIGDPHEVPGGLFVFTAVDPSGAMVAFVGPKGA